MDRDALRGLYRRFRGAERRKRSDELAYWRERKAAEGTLANDHYEPIFTGLVGLSREFYDGKAVLDVGCGPRGSLVWAAGARRRVGLDPLADDYRSLGTYAHPMEYVAASAEAMPFDDASFDVVTSFNSLDHVDDLDRTISEMKRVLRPGGVLVLAVEIGHEPRWTEPQTIGWDICERFEPEFETVRKDAYEPGGESLYDAAWHGRRVDVDPGAEATRPGLLTAVLRRR